MVGRPACRAVGLLTVCLEEGGRLKAAVVSLSCREQEQEEEEVEVEVAVEVAEVVEEEGGEEEEEEEEDHQSL